MLRIAMIAIALIAINLFAEDKTKSLSEILKLEEKGLDDPSLEAAVQIEAATKRFYGYRDNHCTTDEELKATRDCFLKVMDRIIKRAREKVREAEEIRDEQRLRLRPTEAVST